MTPALEVANLTFAFEPERLILRGINFSIFENECVGIVGANGAGKSTLLWCLLGLLPAEGSVRFFGERISKRTLRRIGVVFQNPEDQLFMPNLMDDLTLPLLNRGASADVALARARAALASMGLLDSAHRPATHLSLGERKRASIAAALAGSPELLLLDEPTAELDGYSVRQLSRILEKLTVARVITSHHLAFLQGLATRTLVLAEGRIIAEGPTSQILADEALLEQARLI
jgi:cobalt/nickel transport system ATP-binding protein